MLAFNTTSNWPTFSFIGIPGLEAAHMWISIPFCLLYLVALAGNVLLLILVRTEQNLHEPQFYFLAMLALADLGLSLSTMPSVLAIFWFDVHHIGLNACLTQMFFIHTLSSVESGVLVAMAFDRLVAICAPLSYSRILTHCTVACLSGAALVRGAALLAPLPFFLRTFPFCGANILSHSYCYYPDMLHLACGDVTFSSIYGLICVLCTFAVDAVFILASYMKILGTVMKLGTQDRNWKSLQTCACHLCTVLVFYLPLISLAVLHRYTQETSPILYTTMSNAYLLITPLLNPLVYSLKSRQIQAALRKRFGMQRVAAGE
ncbi:olfactory receptor Olr107 [Oryctolagus cuniculus]|uniref:Olfactory receptor Olr107 (Predicted) n=1 Tax=Oryctolagus cuniculus TaxID=9986 RepID=B8K166_RABIT|nr:olfactory receptor Olr107 [Oryctolagus cuniculus]ACK77539.1 olfactory receptor Olr107 (predicted) [Oryctolagus cuniculus]